VARCTITSPRGHKTVRSFTIEDAKQAKLWGKDGPWSTYPYRQMSWRAFWFAARDSAADVLKGLQGVEELRDMPGEQQVEGTSEVVRNSGAAQDTVTTQSKSDKVAQALKKPTIAEVRAAFEEVKGPDDQALLRDAIALATKAELTVEERTEANGIYHAAKKRAVPESKPTTQEVQQKLKAAKNVDELDLAGSLIEGLECEADLKVALTNDYKALRNDMTKE
jgi:hypothetical protein